MVSTTIDDAAAACEATRRLEGFDISEERHILQILARTHASRPWAASTVDWGRWAARFLAFRAKIVRSSRDDACAGLESKQFVSARLAIIKANEATQLEAVPGCLPLSLPMFNNELDLLKAQADVLKAAHDAMATPAVAWAHSSLGYEHGATLPKTPTSVELLDAQAIQKRCVLTLTSNCDKQI